VLHVAVFGSLVAYDKRPPSSHAKPLPLNCIAFKFKRQIGAESCQIQAVSIKVMGCFVTSFQIVTL
jgi:hypothetical protein